MTEKTNAVSESKPEPKAYCFEDAITLTTFGKYNIYLIFVSALLATGTTTEFICMNQVTLSAKCDLNLSTENLLLSSGFIGAFVGCPFWGYLADKTGRRKIMLVNTFIGSALTIICCFIKYSWLFILLRFLNGFFVAANPVTISAYLGEFHGNKTRGRAITWMHVSNSLANVYIPGMAWLIIPMTWSFYIPFLDLTFRSWRLLLLFCALPNLIAAVCLIFLPESPKYLLAEQKKDECLQILRNMYRINTGFPAEKYEVCDLEREDIVSSFADTKKFSVEVLLRKFWLTLAPIWKGMYGFWSFIICLMTLGTLYITTGFFMWLPEILNRRKKYMSDFPEASKALCNALNHYTNQFSKNQTEGGCSDIVDVYVYKFILILTCISVFTYFIVGWIVNIFGKKKLLVLFYGVSSLAGIGLMFCTEDWLLIILLNLFYLALLCQVLLSIIVIDLYSTHHRATALAFTLLSSKIGTIAGSSTIGELFNYNCYASFGVLSSVALVCAAVTFVLPNVSTKKSDHNSNL